MQPELIALEKQSELLEKVVGDWNDYPNDVLLRDAAKVALTYGETYYWSPQICDLIGEAARKLREPWTLMREMVPNTSGFFWFAKSPSSFVGFPRRFDGDGKWVADTELTGDERDVLNKPYVLPLRAIAWTLFKYGGGDVNGNGPTHVYISAEDKGNLGKSDGIEIQFFVDSPHAEDHGRVIPNGFCQWRFGRTSRDMIDMEVERLKEDNDWDFSKLGADDYASAGVLDNNVICTAFQFIHQEILEAGAKAAPDRSMRKRLSKAKVVSESPWVRIVRLRRKRSVGSEGERDSDWDVNWHFQWMVSGHWRMQPYPTLGIVQPKWIMPYVKGPEDKPFKVTDTIFSVKQ